MQCCTASNCTANNSLKGSQCGTRWSMHFSSQLMFLRLRQIDRSEPDGRERIDLDLKDTSHGQRT